MTFFTVPKCSTLLPPHWLRNKGGQRSERKANRLISGPVHRYYRSGPVRSGSQILPVRSIPAHNFYRFGPVHELLEYEDKDFPTVNSIFSRLFHRCHRFGLVRSGWVHIFDRSGPAQNFYRSSTVRQAFTNGIFSPFRTVTTFTRFGILDWKNKLKSLWENSL